MTAREPVDRHPTRRSAALTLAGIATVAMLPRRAAAAEAWKAYTYNSVATVTASKGLTAILNAVDTGTHGALTIRLNLGGTLQIGATDITEAVADNIVQLGDDAFFLGSVPIGGITRLPMFLHNMDEYQKVWALLDPVLTAAYKEKGIVLLGKYVYPFNVFWSRKKLTALADFAGQKIRVISPEQSEFVKVLGGVPITLGTAEVAAALDRGVVDGAITAASGYGRIWKDLLKYCYRLNVSYIDSMLIANQHAWDRLPGSQQAVLGKAVADITPKTTAAMADEEERLFKELAAGGMVVTTPSPDAVAEAEAKIRPYWTRWAQQRGPEAISLLAKAHAAIGH